MIIFMLKLFAIKCMYTGLHHNKGSLVRLKIKTRNNILIFEKEIVFFYKNHVKIKQIIFE